MLRSATPPGVTSYITGRDPLQTASNGGTGGPSVLTEGLIGGAGALIILLFVFGTLPAVAMPLMIAAASILNTFTLVWILTYITPVSIIVQFLVALVGLGVAIDYLGMIIIGGLGSTTGALIGALLVGLMTNYTGFLLPVATQFASIALMVAVLLWRPQGLYPVASR